MSGEQSSKKLLREVEKMNDLVLWLPAFILPLFCMIYSIAARRKLYLPLPKGLSAKLRDQHTVFLAMLCALMTAAAFSIAEAIGGAGTPAPVRIAGSRSASYCSASLRSISAGFRKLSEERQSSLPRPR